MHSCKSSFGGVDVGGSRGKKLEGKQKYMHIVMYLFGVLAWALIFILNPENYIKFYKFCSPIEIL
jgi:hypothetical protein